MKLKKMPWEMRWGNLIALLAMTFAAPMGESAAETAADAVEIALDTNIVVAANDALKIEYGIMVPSWRIR